MFGRVTRKLASGIVKQTICLVTGYFKMTLQKGPRRTTFFLFLATLLKSNCHSLYDGQYFNVHSSYKADYGNGNLLLSTSQVSVLLECYLLCQQHSDCFSFSVTKTVSLGSDIYSECKLYKLFSFMYPLVEDINTIFVERKYLTIFAITYCQIVIL